MAVRNARAPSPGFTMRRRLARVTRTTYHEYGNVVITLAWVVAATLVIVVAGIWLDLAVGRPYLYRLITAQPPYPSPVGRAAWSARMLAAVVFPSLALVAVGPMLLRPLERVPGLGLALLSGGMLLSTLMTYGQQWHGVFCLARCSPSGIGPLDAIGQLQLYRLAPTWIYGMNHLSGALVACLALAAALLVGRGVVSGRLIAPLPDESRAAMTAAVEAELDTWKVDDARPGWHDTGVFDAVSDTGHLQETGYRIFAVNPRAATKLAASDDPTGDDEPEPTIRRFPAYDYTASPDQA
ncbi:MAG TPA: hypothetical protein VJN88_11310 [Ktedonobacterales bacterium]|nr:hypothetical protein [Ktedonobacterales bacterium]